MLLYLNQGETFTKVTFLSSHFVLDSYSLEDPYFFNKFAIPIFFMKFCLCDELCYKEAKTQLKQPSYSNIGDQL